MRFHRSILPWLLALATTPALAETRYDVEIIVLEHDRGAEVTEERWHPRISVPKFERARSFDESGAEPLPEGFERLDNSEARLASAVQRLRKSSRYRVLRHLRWRQPALEPGRSVPIRIRAGDAIAIEAPSDIVEHPVPARGNQSADEELEETDATTVTDTTGDTDTDDTAVETAESTAGSPEGGGGFRSREPRLTRASVHPLDGTIELVVSRYLHVHADLYFTGAVQWDETVVPPRERQAAEDREETPEATEEEESGSTADPDPEDGGAQASGATTPAAEAASARIARGPDGAAMLSFPFRQSRRMRSGELHYLDHPLVGLLVLVTPYEDESEDTDSGGDSG